MPSVRALARVTMTAAFQRMKARIRRSRCSSPGNHGSSSAGMVFTYGVDTVAGKSTWRLRARSQQLHQQVAGTGPAVGVDHGVEGVEPLGGLARVDVGDLVGDPVEEHVPMFAPRPPAPNTRAHGPIRIARATESSVVGNGPDARKRGADRRLHRRLLPGEPRAGRLGLGGPRRAVTTAGGDARTTNQRMEITAVLEALGALDRRRRGPRASWS